jgi:predicted peroxiredoxin
LVKDLRNVKIWTTVDSRLKKDLKTLTKVLGFKTETECMREALRQGVQALKAQRSVFGMLEKRKDSILQSAGLLEEEYERLGTGELELKIRSQWRRAEQSA